MALRRDILSRRTGRVRTRALSFVQLRPGVPAVTDPERKAYSVLNAEQSRTVPERLARAFQKRFPKSPQGLRDAGRLP